MFGQLHKNANAAAVTFNSLLQHRDLDVIAKTVQELRWINLCFM